MVVLQLPAARQAHGMHCPSLGLVLVLHIAAQHAAAVAVSSFVAVGSQSKSCLRWQVPVLQGQTLPGWGSIVEHPAVLRRAAVLVLSPLLCCRTGVLDQAA